MPKEGRAYRGRKLGVRGDRPVPASLRVRVPTVGIRLADGTDEQEIGFLFRRLLAELHHVAPWRNMPRGLYFPYMHRRLEHTLTRAVVRVAYPDAWEEDGKVYGGNTRHIIGFVVAEPSDVGLIVHYVYTRRDYTPKGGNIKACYRRNGIAKRLVEGMMKDYEMDHIVFTIWGQEIWQSETFFQKVTEEWKDKLTYNPELFTTLLPYQWERGIVATLDPHVAKAIHKIQGISPVKF